MTDKDSYPWLLAGDIPFLRIYPFFGELSPPVAKDLANLGAGSAGAEDRLRDIYGTLESSAYKDSRPLGLHRVDLIDLSKAMITQFNAVFLFDLQRILGRIQSDG